MYRKQFNINTEGYHKDFLLETTNIHCHVFKPYFTTEGFSLYQEFDTKDIIKEGECTMRCQYCGCNNNDFTHNQKWKEVGIIVQNKKHIPPKEDYSLNYDFLNLGNTKPLHTFKKCKKVEYKGNNRKGFPCGIHSRICGNGCPYRNWWDTKAFNKKAKVLQEICPSKRVRKKFVPNRFYKKTHGKYECVSKHYKGNLYVKKDGVYWRWNKRPKNKISWLKPVVRRQQEVPIEENFMKILKIK